MNLQNVLIYLFLAVGLLSFALTAIGILFFHDAYDQIHFLTPGSVIGAMALPAAILVKEGFSQLGAKGLAIALLLVLANPVLTHAIARAARVRRNQQWQPRDGDHIVVPRESAT